MSKLEPIRISIVIVNYKTPQMTINCLESIHKNFSKRFSISVYVADNKSGDGSVTLIRRQIEKKKWSSWVSILQLEKNGGFAYGNNQVIRNILKSSDNPKYIWLLNPDTIIYEDACLQLTEFLDKNPMAGLAGSRLEDKNGTPLASAFRAHSFISELIHGAKNTVVSYIFYKWIVPMPASEIPHPADWLPGASIMIKREVFEQVGLLDEEYFMYYEESDFCLKCRRKGWQCWHVPASKVVHFEGASSKESPEIKKYAYPASWYESRRHYYRKNYGTAYAAIADLSWLFGHCILNLQTIMGRKTNPFENYSIKMVLKKSPLLFWISRCNDTKENLY